MQPQDFCYWLQGFSELVGTNPTKEQWIIIQDHLNLVFNKVTPNRSFGTEQYCDGPISICSMWDGQVVDSYPEPKKLCNLEELNMLDSSKVLISC